MSYRPHPEQNPHAPHHPGHHPGEHRGQSDYYEERRRREEAGDTVANVVHIVTGAVAAIFALHILFVVFDANQGNEFVSFVYGLAQVLVLGLGDVFTPDDAVLGVVLNYGLAALVYLVIGRLIIKAIRR